MAGRLKLAVLKFASCDGFQLSLLDCEDELLAVTDAVDVANFLEASRAVQKGPYDLTLVEGSITTPHDAERIQAIRKASRLIVTIAVDTKTLTVLQGEPDTRDNIGLIEQLKAENPEAVVYMTDPAKWVGKLE